MGQKKGTKFPNNPQIPNVPKDTPMWDGPGESTLGNMTRTWILFFQRLSGGVGTTGSLNDASGAAAGAQWAEEMPSGKVDGDNVTFTLSYAPIAGSLDLSLNIRQFEGQDYTISGKTITMTVAPKPTDLQSPYYPPPVGAPGWWLARYQHE